MLNQLELLQLAIHTSIIAGKAILEVYHTDFDVDFKKDSSPLTLADGKAHEIIVAYLKETGIPVLSEEGKDIPYDERKNWNQLWVVDPLDGTKEFVKRNDEFTVNIALIQDHKPILGVVYAPVLDELYFGEESLGAFKIKKASEPFELVEKMIPDNKLPLSEYREKSFFGIVASRSHLNKETEQFINTLKKEKDEVKIVSKGSSLKLCMVAEGVADIYPRFAPTMEWDTAAGDAVVRASGAQTLNAVTQKPLVYNKEDILNPWFVVKRE